MDEYFLQFLWKFQKFSTNNLKLHSGEDLTVFNPGYQNFDSGPDFMEGKIRIDDIIWSGSVEVHYNSSDWYHHRHQKDPAYQNVVLHVVWKADKIVTDAANKELPTLELSKYAPADLEKEYRKYINQPEVILCASHLAGLPSIQVSDMLDKAFVSRLEDKAEKVRAIYHSTEKDWEETAYRLLARNYGFKTNAEPFEKLATSLPYKILKKHLDHPHQVEALIFGMAGFLEDPEDHYATDLAGEFDFLMKKYHLEPMISRHHWKYAKLRPANFPTVRLAQFSAMITAARGLFSKLIAVQDVKEATSFVRQQPSGYWTAHYDFGKESKRENIPGIDSAENIIVNSVVPLLAAYSGHIDDLALLEKAEMLLENVKPESNLIVRKWSELGIAAKHAKDSQALLFKYQAFCKEKKCLRCNIGVSIIGK